MTDELADRVRLVDEACREAGRDPRSLRRSTWAGGDVLRSPEAFRAWVENHRALGFTDFTAGLPGPELLPAVRRIAAEVIPALRATG